MTPKLTHTECCRIVEDALERVAKTLAYIRMRLDSGRNAKRTQLSLFEKNTVEEANLLCNINYYGAYLQGARTMYLALKDGGYLDIPKEADGTFTAKETRIMNNAHLQCFCENARNLDWFLHGTPKDIDLATTFERDKKGKIVGAKSKFYKKEIMRKEV